MRRGGGWGLQSYAQVADQGGGWRKRAGSGRGGQGTRNVPGPETAGIMAVNRQVVVAEREAQDLKNQALKKIYNYTYISTYIATVYQRTIVQNMDCS